MTLFRNSANGGTDGAGTLGTQTLANSTFSGVALTPVGTAPVYSNDLAGTWRGLWLKFVTPTGTSYDTSPISGSPTAMSVTFYDYMTASVGSTSEVHSLRNGTTRVSAVNHTNLNKIQFFANSTTALWTSTVNIPLNSVYRVVYTYDASGNWTFAWYLGDSMTPIETPASGTADFSTAGAPTIIAFGKRSGNWTGTRYMKDVAWDTNSSTAIPPTGSTVGPYGKIAHIGDSTSSQDGNGAVNVPLAYTNAGWLAGDISFYGVGSKTIIGSDANGKTTMQNIDDARATLGEEPKVWVIGLATNSRTATDATTDSDVATVMAKINSVAATPVVWVGISQATANGGLDANSVRRNARLKFQESLYSNFHYFDLDTYIRNGRDETGIWFNPIDANFAHMSVTGYTTLRNPLIAEFAKGFISGMSAQVAGAPSSTGTLAQTTSAAMTISAALSGAGTLTATSTMRGLAVAAFSGSGTLAATGSQGYIVTAAFSGSGSLAATSVPSMAATAGFSGAGTLAATTQPKFIVVAAFSGGGTLSQTTVPKMVAAAAFSGAGTLAAISAAGGTIIAAFSGSGTLAATTVPRMTASAAFSGAGTLSAAAIAELRVGAAFGGTGTLTATTGASIAVTAAFSGQGSLVATAVPKMIVVASLSGAGTLSASIPAPSGVVAYLGSIPIVAILVDGHSVIALR